MKTKILLPLFSLIAFSCFGQDSSFQLKDYKYRTPGFRALEFSTFLNGNLTASKAPTVKQNQRLFELTSTWITYRKFSSSDRRWHSSYLSLYPSFSMRTQEDNSGKTRANHLQSSVNWQFEDRFYGKQNWFFQLGGSLTAMAGSSKQTQSQMENRSRAKNANGSLWTGLGRGRTEVVNDAQMALYILNDLRDQGLSSQLADAATINEFAQLITQINNRRIFDFRRRRIFELTSIDSFLRAKGITPSPGIREFTIENDNWTLAFNPQRLSGKYWYVQLRPSGQFSTGNQTSSGASSKSTNEQQYTLLNLGPAAGYENFKPVSLKWQRNFGASAAWQRHREKQTDRTTLNGVTTETKAEYKQQGASLYAFYGIGYYPNNRTLVNATLGFDGRYIRYHESSLKQSRWMRPSLGFSADYFVSYRTRLTANLSLYGEFNHFEYTSLPDDNSRLLNCNLIVGVTHSFF